MTSHQKWRAGGHDNAIIILVYSYRSRAYVLGVEACACRFTAVVATWRIALPSLKREQATLFSLCVQFWLNSLHLSRLPKNKMKNYPPTLTRILWSSLLQHLISKNRSLRYAICSDDPSIHPGTIQGRGHIARPIKSDDTPHPTIVVKIIHGSCRSLLQGLT